jgi:hypothetical protein
MGKLPKTAAACDRSRSIALIDEAAGQRRLSQCLELMAMAGAVMVGCLVASAGSAATGSGIKVVEYASPDQKPAQR